MTHKIRYADRAPEHEVGPIGRSLKAVITVGVWMLVALAGLTVWARLAA